MAMRILLVEDDARIARFVSQALREQAYAVDATAVHGKRRKRLGPKCAGAEDETDQQAMFCFIGDEKRHRHATKLIRLLASK